MALSPHTQSLRPANPLGTVALHTVPAVFVPLWGTGFIVAGLGLPHAEPFTFLFIRFTLVTVLLLTAALVLRSAWPSRTTIAHAVVPGLLLLVLSLGAISWLYLLLRNGAAARVSLLFFLVPAVTAVMAWLLFDERFGGLELLGMLLTVAGVAVVNLGAGRARR